MSDLREQLAAALDPAVELVARTIVHDWMDHLGYTEEALAEADQDRDHTRCDRTPEGWFCLDEDGNSHHPVHDEADEVAELVMFTLDHPVLAGRLLPPVVQTREEWRIREDGEDGYNVGSVNDDLDLTRQLLAVGRRNEFWGSSARIQARTISTLADDGSPYGGATLTGKWRNVDE